MARTRAAAPALAASGETPVTALPGVGPAVAAKLQARGIGSLQDLWLHLPLRYEDRTRLSAIATLLPGSAAQVEGRVVAVERGFRYRPVLRVALEDDSRGTLVLRFFHFRAAQVLDRLTQGAPNRIVIFDSPPALAASPAAELAKYVGQALIVVRADRTGQGALEDAISLLSGCPNIQLLLNATHFSPSGRGGRRAARRRRGHRDQRPARGQRPGAAQLRGPAAGGPGRRARRAPRRQAAAAQGHAQGAAARGDR